MKREQEKKTVGAMIEIYCHGVHKSRRGTLCKECERLADFARLRTDCCPFMETKTFCSACKVHCYPMEKREQMKKVMRYAGPRMLFRHPILVMRHAKVTLDSKRQQKTEKKE